MSIENDSISIETAINTPVIDEYAKKSDDLKAVHAAREALENAPAPQEEAAVSRRYEELATLKSDELRLKGELDGLQSRRDSVYLTTADLARVIEIWTGVPTGNVTADDFEKVGTLEENLHKRIIGQDQAISAVVRAIKRKYAGVSVKRKPVSFIFAGPTGVGKTELVKQLAQNLFDSPESLLRLDMSEYMEKHSVSRMIGSPPGYVGYDEAGQLTEKVRRKPYSVILFDEIEKAHPDVMNILMQILDEGHIDDAQGRNINFENTIICMTSNAGSTDKSVGVGFNRTEDEITREKAMKGLRDFLRPEFISRIDEIVVFRQLAKEDFARIAALMLDEMKEPLAEKNITITYDQPALDLIAEKSFGKPYGARDIRRVIRQDIEDKVAELIINDSSNISSIDITAEDGGIKVNGTKKEMTE